MCVSIENQMNSLERSLSFNRISAIIHAGLSGVQLLLSSQEIVGCCIVLICVSLHF